MSEQNVIKAGFRFKNGNTSFEVLSESEKIGVWHVTQRHLGAGFTPTAPKIVEISEKRISQLHEEEIGNAGIRDMNTVGERSGARTKKRDSRPRRRWQFTHTGRVIGVPC